MSTTLPALAEWVESVRSLTRADAVHWCDGSDTEYRTLIEQMLATGLLEELALKAGLSRDGWREATLRTFQAEHFEE